MADQSVSESTGNGNPSGKTLTDSTTTESGEHSAENENVSTEEQGGETDMDVDVMPKATDSVSKSETVMDIALESNQSLQEDTSETDKVVTPERTETIDKTTVSEEKGVKDTNSTSVEQMLTLADIDENKQTEEVDKLTDEDGDKLIGNEEATQIKNDDEQIVVEEDKQTEKEEVKQTEKEIDSEIEKKDDQQSEKKDDQQSEKKDDEQSEKNDDQQSEKKDDQQSEKEDDQQSEKKDDKQSEKKDDKQSEKEEANQDEEENSQIENENDQPVEQEKGKQVKNEDDKQTEKVEVTSVPNVQEPLKETYESAFEKFLNRPSAEQAVSDNESKSSEAKVLASSEVKPDVEFKKFNQISPEETSNSSWYKMPKNKEEAMDVEESALNGDENSNMSILENASVISSNIGENSLLSYQVDESSNLSVPDDGNSVPQFSGHQPVFDESANMNPPSNVTFARPDTPSSINADTTMSESTPTAKRNRRGTLQLAAEEANEQGHNITASDIFEYQWPQETDADWYILQEQISVYLDVKSFKRKYPEIFRRVCDKIEKDFLREKCVVTETQSDLGLTALKSEDVHDLMSRDYPAKYKEFLKILHDREKKLIAEKMKEYDAPRLEKEKMIEYTKKAMKSSSDWNRNMLKERNKERRAYFDMQTFAIHYPKGKFRKLPNVQTSQTSYPLSLIPGQFQEYYRKYSPAELKYFPLNTTVNNPKKMDPVAKLQQQIVKRQQQQQLALQQSVVVVQRPQPVSVQEPQPKPAQPAVTGTESDSDSGSSSSSGSDNEANKKKEVKIEDKKTEKLKKKEKSISRGASKEKSVEPIFIKKELTECRICKDEKDKSKIPVGEGLINCSECQRSGHPSCLDLTDEMLKVIKTYPWQCMECKTCVQCMEPYDEDKMLFCDNCDRGYHTFCVGLKSLPTGKWECKSCTGDTTPITPLPRPPPKAKRGRKPKDPNAAANQTSTPAKLPKDKQENNSKLITPTRMTPRREAKDLEKATTKDVKETK